MTHRAYNTIIGIVILIVCASCSISPENDALKRLEETIRETIHDPAVICDLLKEAGFTVVRCADRMLEDGGHGTTWFLIARKPL